MVGAAYAAEPPKEVYCSEGVRLGISGNRLVLATEDSERVYERKQSVGTGLNGVIYADKKGETAVLLEATIWMDANQTPPYEPTVRIFNDHVYWPCED